MLGPIRSLHADSDSNQHCLRNWLNIFLHPLHCSRLSYHFAKPVSLKADAKLACEVVPREMQLRPAVSPLMGSFYTFFFGNFSLRFIYLVLCSHNLFLQSLIQSLFLLNIPKQESMLPLGLKYVNDVHSEW